MVCPKLFPLQGRGVAGEQLLNVPLVAMEDKHQNSQLFRLVGRRLLEEKGKGLSLVIKGTTSGWPILIVETS